MITPQNTTKDALVSENELLWTALEKMTEVAKNYCMLYTELEKDPYILQENLKSFQKIEMVQDMVQNRGPLKK